MLLSCFCIIVINVCLTCGLDVVINVHYPLGYDDSPANIEIPELNRLNMTCDVTNKDDYPDGQINYRWTWDGDNAWEWLQPNLDKTMETHDSGMYSCEVMLVEPAQNEVVETNVHVLYFPRWQQGYLRKFAGSIGETVTLECHVHSYPDAQFYWSFNGQNITSSSVPGSMSALDVFINSQSNYGVYNCHAYNSEGQASFSISLNEPDIPDAPQDCVILNVTAHEAELGCRPGYAGGEPLDFTVDKQSPHDNRETAKSSHVEHNSQMVTILVEELQPNTNWTLSIYQINEHGRSQESIGVIARTLDGPRLGGGSESELPTTLIAIICGVAGGVILIVVLIATVTCVLMRRKPKEESETRFTAADKPLLQKDTGAYMMDDGENSQQFQRQGSNRKSRNSFRAKNQPRALSGMRNPNYDGSSEQMDNMRHVDYNSPMPSSGNASNILNLGYNPGESTDGIENRAYSNHGEMQLRETGFNQRHPVNNTGNRENGAVLRLQNPNSYDRANRLSQGQPSLAGLGALSYYPNPTQHGAPQMSRTNGGANNYTDRVSLPGVQRPQFEPEVTWEFPRNKLYIRRKLGDGSFGEVWRATADGILGMSGKVVVAVKMLKDGFTPEEKRALLKELEVMKMLQPHPNIIPLLGCCTTSQPLCLIMGYAQNGSLQDLLRMQRSTFDTNNLSASDIQPKHNLKVRDLNMFGLHVASGMDYIASQMLLHRDLAARNVLVDDQLICKICDFGSARDIAQMRQYESKTQRRLPIRWMAPESLYQCIYSTASDVWSFGILLWEIITLGSSPYPGMSGPDVMTFVQKGCRMDQPRHCNDALYAVMKDCTHQFPQKRPTFSILVHRLTAILDQPPAHLYIDQLEDNIYDILPEQPGEKC